MTKKILKGVVTSAKNNKTIVVQVVRKFKHPFYEKIIKRSNSAPPQLNKYAVKSYVNKPPITGISDWCFNQLMSGCASNNQCEFNLAIPANT